MNPEALAWLLEEDNPAMRYRTKTEILGEPANKEPVIAWINGFLPEDWQRREGLWYTYWLTAVAECGLSWDDIPMDVKRATRFEGRHGFECGCGDFMRLRALVRLGLGAAPTVAELIRGLPQSQLPDGGFLCAHRMEKRKNMPKSCAKATLHALLFAAECRKRGIETGIEAPLIEYFRRHNLFYRTDDLKTLMLDGRAGWRTIDCFYPFEAMRVGLQNVVESLCVLGLGEDECMAGALAMLQSKRGADGRYPLEGTLTKSYLPKERAGVPSKWVTFYALLAETRKGGERKR